jgi:dTDP-4-dehydrorhamnose reductase
MISVAVIGARGQLGTDLVQTLERAGRYQVHAFGHGEIECTQPASVHDVLRAIRPQVVVNCAAFVRVDECEDFPATALAVNSLGALHVARACATIEALCVYISTDYVFDGAKDAPYTEDDPPDPINVYGISKWAGEALVRQACPRWLIARTSSLFGKAGSRSKGGNFVERVLSKARQGHDLTIVQDIWSSPTYTRDAADALEYLLRNGSTGLFHIANEGGCSWFEFAERATAILGLRCRIAATLASEYPMKARRPRDSRLASTRSSTGVKKILRPWHQALEAYLRENNSHAAANR